MQVGMRQFSAGSVEWLRSEAAAGAGRQSLAAGPVDREGWVNGAGAPCLVPARLALPEIARHFDVPLPPPGRRVASGPPLPVYPDTRSEGSLAELGGVSLQLATAKEDRRAFRAMMASHHPRGEPRAPGARLFHWITCPRLGRIGGLSFHATNWHQAARDGFIGWSPRARMANPGLVGRNSRCLVLPGVRVPHLASHALALAARRLPDDWEELHGVRPAMACTRTTHCYT